MLKHGYSSGGKNHPLAQKISDIKFRCTNENSPIYKYYGGRGITVCDEWMNSHAAFIEWSMANGWKEGLDIERKDNNGNYTPDNCVFVEHQVNCCNRRKYSNNSSGYTGVYYSNNKKRWIATYEFNKKKKQVGSYKTAKLAALARDAYNLAHGSLLPFNFEVMNA